MAPKIKIVSDNPKADHTEKQYGQLAISPKNFNTLFFDLERKSLRKEKNTDLETSSTTASLTTANTGSKMRILLI
jgi:hypothetical protein